MYTKQNVLIKLKYLQNFNIQQKKSLRDSSVFFLKKYLTAHDLHIQVAYSYILLAK